MEMILLFNDHWLARNLEVFNTPVTAGTVASSKLIMVKSRHALERRFFLDRGNRCMTTRTLSNFAGMVFLKKIIIAIVPTAKCLFFAVDMACSTVCIFLICGMTMQQFESSDIEFNR